MRQCKSKKLLAILVAFTMLLGLAAPITVRADYNGTETPVNLVQNGDFSDGLATWRGGVNDFEVLPGEAPDGLNSLYLRRPAFNNSIWSADFTLEANQAYEVSMLVNKSWIEGSYWGESRFAVIRADSGLNQWNVNTHTIGTFAVPGFEFNPGWGIYRHVEFQRLPGYNNGDWFLASMRFTSTEDIEAKLIIMGHGPDGMFGLQIADVRLVETETGPGNGGGEPDPRVNVLNNGTFAQGMAYIQNWDPKPYLDADGNPVDYYVPGGRPNPVFDPELMPRITVGGGRDGSNAFFFPAYDQLQTSALLGGSWGGPHRLVNGRWYEISVVFRAPGGTSNALIGEIHLDWAAVQPVNLTLSADGYDGWITASTTFVANRNTSVVALVIRHFDATELYFDEVFITEIDPIPDCEYCDDAGCEVCAPEPGTWEWRTISETLFPGDEGVIQGGGGFGMPTLWTGGAIRVGDRLRVSIRHRSSITGGWATPELRYYWGDDAVVFQPTFGLNTDTGGNFITQTWEVLATASTSGSMIIMWHDFHGLIELQSVLVEIYTFIPADRVPDDIDWNISVPIFGNIFNYGDAMAANAPWSGDATIVPEGRGVGAPAWRSNGFVGFTTIPLEPSTQYRVRAFARNANPGAYDGPQRPLYGDGFYVTSHNRSKISFQYGTNDPSYDGFHPHDRQNMYITSHEWGWTEMTFTTPPDMTGTWAGDPMIVFAMRAGTMWIEQLIVERVSDGVNIFNDGNNFMAGYVMAGTWEGHAVPLVNEGPITPTNAVFVAADGNAYTPIPIEAGRSYDAWVLARGDGTLSFGGIVEITISGDEYEWHRVTFTAPLDFTDANVRLSSVSGLYIEGIVVMDLNPPPRPVYLDIDINKTYQTIEGFGFFGAKRVWWSGPNPNDYFSAEWIDEVLIDLGTSMWRNEAYPFLNPACGVIADSDLRFPMNPNCTGTHNCCLSDFDRGLTTVRPAPDHYTGHIWHRNQDTNWLVQRPMVMALYNRSVELAASDDPAHAHITEPLRIILTAWTPPAQWKTNQSTKGGGTIMPQYYEDYGRWWVNVIDMYLEAGVPVYAVSLQNEPYFAQSYNSMRIYAWDYVAMVRAAVPIINYYHPDVLIFAAEGMLDQDNQWWGHGRQNYHDALLADPVARYLIDAFAVHGYTDGIHALGIERHKHYWTLERTKTGNTPNWMTETSGYTYDWLDSHRPGALNLAAAIQSALLYGDLTAWVYWQGHTMGRGSYYDLWSSHPEFIDQRNKFAVSQHFYRYIRPGAVRVDTAVTGVEVEFDLLVTAYRDDNLDKIIVTFVNTSEFDHSVTIRGLGDLSFRYFITTGDSNVNFAFLHDTGPDSISIPAQSVVTLVADYDFGVTHPVKCDQCGSYPCECEDEYPTFTFDIFNNGEGGSPSRPNAGLAAAGIIRMWTQLDGVNAHVHLVAADTIEALDQGGNCAEEFMRIGRVWQDGTGWLDYFDRIDVDKDGGAWQYINLYITVYGQTVHVLLVNALFEEPVLPVFSFDIFNNGEGGTPSRPNAGLAEAGLIRMWTQLDGVNAPVYFAATDTIVATDQDGNCAEAFIRVGRVWQAGTGWLDYFNMIDVDKDGGSWRYINFYITVYGQTVHVLLVNANYTGQPHEFDCEYCEDEGCEICQPVQPIFYLAATNVTVSNTNRHVSVFVGGTAEGAITLNLLDSAPELVLQVRDNLWTPTGPVEGLVIGVAGNTTITESRTVMLEVTRQGITVLLLIELVAN